MRLPLFMILIALAVSSCQSSTSEKKVEADYFFDLEDFMKKEIDQLNARQPLVEKRIVLKDSNELKRLDSLDYNKELALFTKADINRVAWKDKYKADSLYQDEDLVKVTYQALDQDLKTHLLEVSFEKGKVTHVHARAITESIVADVFKDMDYWPGKGYKLTSTQSTALSTETAVEIEAVFIQ
jgi:hypothetical protein